LATRQIPDKKLKGQLRYSEKLATEAAQKAAKAEEWLLPSETGVLEAEGLERTWRFSQVRQAHLISFLHTLGVNAARLYSDQQHPENAGPNTLGSLLYCSQPFNVHAQTYWKALQECSKNL